MRFDKLLKLKQRMCAFALAITMPLTISGCKNNSEMTEDELNDYISFMTSINSIYNYDEFYITIDEVEKIIEMSEKTYECDNNFNGNIDEIINKIKANSIDFINQYPKYLPALENKNQVEKILENILTELVNNATNDINEDMCAISDLSIVFSTDKLYEKGNTYGYYDPDKNMLCLFPNDIYQTSESERIDYNILLEETIRHELNHVRQCCCACREKKGQPNIDINISTLIESSAESQIYNQTENINNNLSVYQNEMQSESLILLLGLFHDDITINDYYNALFNSNLKEFYDFCGVKTAEEIHKLYKILYAIDGHNLRNKFIMDFINLDEVKTYGDIKEIIGYDYRVDIFSKVLKNMMTYTYEHNDFKLEDNLVMLDIIKSLIVSETCNYEFGTNEEIKRTYETDFSQNIYCLENKYIEFLSEYYNKEIGEVRTIEEDIYYIASEIVNSYNLDSEIEDENIKSIIDKFPLLKAIIKPNFIYIGEYDNFIEDSGVTLIKNK